MTEEKQPKMVIGLRAEPWFAAEVDKYAKIHNCNRTDAVHGLMKDLKIKNDLAEKQIKDLTEMISKQTTYGTAPTSRPIEEAPKNYNAPSVSPANQIECPFAGADHKTKMMLHKRWCDACALNSQTPEMPCPKRRAADAPKPTTKEIDAALEGREQPHE
jgi:hypothetical protein